MSRSSTVRNIAWLWFIATIAVLIVGFRQAIFLVPTEETMGNVQRIFYYHLPHAILGLVFPYVNFVASLAFIYWRRREPLKALTADALAARGADARWGWDRYIANLEVRDVPGDHVNHLTRPHVHALAQAVRPDIERAGGVGEPSEEIPSP